MGPLPGSRRRRRCAPPRARSGARPSPLYISWARSKRPPAPSRLARNPARPANSPTRKIRKAPVPAARHQRNNTEFFLPDLRESSNTRCGRQFASVVLSRSMDSCRTLATESIPAPHAKTNQKSSSSIRSRDAPCPECWRISFQKNAALRRRTSASIQETPAERILFAPRKRSAHREIDSRSPPCVHRCAQEEGKTMRDLPERNRTPQASRRRSNSRSTGSASLPWARPWCPRYR